MKNLKFLFVFLIIIFSQLLYSQITVSKVIDKSQFNNKEGIYYFLPKTVMKIDFKIKETEYKKGPFSDYSKQLLGANPKTLYDHSEFEIIEINISKLINPDPDNLYFIDFSEKKKNQMFQFGFDEQNFLTGYTLKDIDKNEKPRFDKNERYSENLLFNNTFNDNFISPDTIIRKISLDSTEIEQVFISFADDSKSLIQQAREAVSIIKKLEENIMNLLTGYQEVAYDKGSIEFMHNKLNQLKNDYTDLFIGKQRVSYRTVSYYYTPSFSNTYEALFRFSNSEGIVPLGSQKGEEVAIQIQPVIGDVYNIPDYTVNIEEEAIFYRIPEISKIQILRNQFSIFTSLTEINQLGDISKVGLKNVQEFYLNNKTGGIKYIKLK